MGFELFSAVAVLALLSLIGIPFARICLRFVAASDQNCRLQAWALAPAFGMAIWVFAGAACYSFFGASRNWGLFVAVSLAVASAFYLFRQSQPANADVGSGTSNAHWGLIFVALASTAILSSAAFRAGVDGTMIRSNPSDAVMYISSAESTRTASVSEISAGANLSDLDAATHLVANNPIGLYSARMIEQRRLRLGTFVSLGWYAQVSGLPIERVLWSFALICSVSLAMGLFGLARLAGVGVVLAASGALAASLGFWQSMARDADAFSSLQASAILVALFAVRVLNWRSRNSSWGLTIATGVLLACAVIAYTEYAPFILCILICDFAFRILVGPARLQAGLHFACALAVTLATILLSGQLSYLAQVMAKQLSFASSSQSAMGDFVYADQMIQYFIPMLSGLFVYGTSESPVGGTGGLPIVLFIASCVVGAAVAAGILLAVFRRDWHGFAILGAGAVGSFMLAGYGAFIRQDPYIFLRVMSFSGVFIMPLIAIAAYAWSERITQNNFIRLAGPTLAVAFFAAQAAYPLVVSPRPQYQMEISSGYSFDLTSLHRTLEKECPCHLSVYLPPSNNWWSSLIASFSVRHFDPTYQMGYFFDNKPSTLIVPNSNTSDPPNLFLTNEQFDNVGGSKGATLIWSGGELRLYRVSELNLNSAAPVTLLDEANRTQAVQFEQWKSIDWKLLNDSTGSTLQRNATVDPLRADLVELVPGAFVSAVFIREAVAAGDIVQVRYTAWSDSSGTVRSILQRHCNSDRESTDFAIIPLELTKKPQEFELEVQFQTPFDCVRVDVQNMDTKPLRIFLSRPKIKRLN